VSLNDSFKLKTVELDLTQGLDLSPVCAPCGLWLYAATVQLQQAATVTDK
jgi:hypothetical protein